MSLVPKQIFFVKGGGISSNSRLLSFEKALRKAGIEKFNLVSVSSIIPPYCKEVSKNEGLKNLKTGQIVHTVLSKISSNIENQIICSSIGVAQPADQSIYGYLSEIHATDEKPEIIGRHSENIALEMLATSLGVPFNSTSNFDENKELLRIKGKIVETKNITEMAIVKEEWATVLTAAIFIF
jgi:arginine decarboxylase